MDHVRGIQLMRPGRGSVPFADIVVVDDDPISRAICGHLLTSQGHTVHEVGSASEALEHLRTVGADLLIADVMMPQMDGVELAQAVRSCPEYWDVPILVVSSLDDRATRVRAVETADDFLGKPIDGLELCLRVATLLKLRARMLQMRREIADLRERNASLTEENASLREALHENLRESGPGPIANRGADVRPLPFLRRSPFPR